MSQNRRSYEWNEEATEATGLLEHELAGLEVGDAFEADGKAKLSGPLSSDQRGPNLRRSLLHRISD